MQGNRRAFLTGAFSRAPVMRPFGAAGEDAFRAACTGCGDCVRACPEGVLIIAGSGNGDGTGADSGSGSGDGRPRFEPRRGACTFCGACIEACPTEALAPGRPWPWRAQLRPGCLSLGAVQCRSCQDRCESGAIRFRLLPGGRAEARIDTDSCIGCGGCAAACPADAIRFSRTRQDVEPLRC